MLLRTAELGRTHGLRADTSAQLACTAAQLPQQHTTAGQNTDRFHPEWKTPGEPPPPPTELSVTPIKPGLVRMRVMRVSVTVCVC